MKLKNKHIRAIKSGEGIVAHRFESGRQIWDEALLGGSLIPRYRNCFGQIMPEMHLNPENILRHAQEYNTGSIFRIKVLGNLVDGNWEFVSFDEVKDESGLRGEAKVFCLKLVDKAAGIEVSQFTRLDGSDFIVRWLRIKNIGAKPLALTGVSPMGGEVWVHHIHSNTRDHNYFMEEALKAGEAPFSIAYNHSKDWGKEGDFYFDSLCMPNYRIFSEYGKSGWTRPAAWLRNRMNGETLVCELAWSGNWQFNTQVWHGREEGLAFDVGLLESDDEILRVLMPQEECTSPKVHFGLFRDGDDVIVQCTHEHVRNTVLPKLPDGVPVSEIEANHRGYLCDRESEEGIKADIDVAKAIGTELYVVDAGWYGDWPNKWWENIGDWNAGPWMKNGFEPIPEYAHQSGMRFGLWIEVEAVGPRTKLKKEHPEWVATRHGMPVCANGRSLDLANPEVEKWVTELICRNVEMYKLDMYRIDHNHSIGIGPTRETAGYVENTLWRYYEAFERIFRTVHARYPWLVMQNCAGGGGRLDWGTMSLFHNVELSDWMRQPRSTRILAGVMMSLPPEILLRTFGTEVGEMIMDGDIDSQLRICMICRPIYRGIAPGLDDLAPYLKEKILYSNKLYKEFIRPLMEDCKVYHHTPFQPIHATHDKTVLEYAAEDKSKGLVAIFTSADTCDEYINIRPRGVNRGYTYRVSFDNSGESAVYTGDALINNGILVHIGFTMSSELVLLEKI